MFSTLRKLFYSDKWNIGYVYQSAQDFIQRKQLDVQITWLKEAEADYAADPFVLVHDRDIHIYYEELKNVWSKGEIKLLEGFDFTKRQAVKGIHPNIHLSYPYVFNHQGQFYCIPETGQANEVALYQIDKGDLAQFKKIRVLLKGARFVDSSLIWYQDEFWLFTSISGVPNVFYIYYAKDLADTFKPHGLNPIQTSNKNFRGAGNLFIVDGKLYRPTQNMELRYGGSVMINQVLRLSESEFESEEAFEVKPKAPYYKGLHHINTANNLIVFDGKRDYFSLTVGLKKIVRKAFLKVSAFTNK